MKIKYANEKGIVKTIKNEKLQILKEARHSELVSESKGSNLSNLELGSVVVSVDPSYYRHTEVAHPHSFEVGGSAITRKYQAECHAERSRSIL